MPWYEHRAANSPQKKTQIPIGWPVATGMPDCPVPVVLAASLVRHVSLTGDSVWGDYEKDLGEVKASYHLRCISKSTQSRKVQRNSRIAV